MKELQPIVDAKPSRLRAISVGIGLLALIGVGSHLSQPSDELKATQGHVLINHTSEDPQSTIRVIVKENDNPTTIARNYALDSDHREKIVDDIYKQDPDGVIHPGQAIELSINDIQQMPDPTKSNTP